MTQVDLLPLIDAARLIRARLFADLTDPHARLIDATIRSQRSGSRRFAFNDGLIGFGAALREVLLSWGVPDRFIHTNDTPVEGHFVRRKYWDFVVTDAGGREQALIENWRIARASSSVSRACHLMLGAMKDLLFTGRRAFVGLVFVTDATRQAMPPRRRTIRRRQLERFACTCAMDGLLDALTWMEVSPCGVEEPSAVLGLERFLETLYRRLSALPAGTWGQGGRWCPGCRR